MKEGWRKQARQSGGNQKGKELERAKSKDKKLLEENKEIRMLKSGRNCPKKKEGKIPASGGKRRQKGSEKGRHCLLKSPLSRSGNSESSRKEGKITERPPLRRKQKATAQTVALNAAGEKTIRKRYTNEEWGRNLRQSKKCIELEGAEAKV